MIDVHTANTTPNGVKVPIALEELGVPYRLLRVDLGAQQQKSAAFLRLNPNGRIPVIDDHNGPAGAPLSVFESGAILSKTIRLCVPGSSASRRGRPYCVGCRPSPERPEPSLPEGRFLAPAAMMGCRFCVFWSGAWMRMIRTHQATRSSS